jgi:hypothetical protein
MRDRAHLDGSELATPIVGRDGFELATPIVGRDGFELATPIVGRDGSELATGDSPIVAIDDIKNGVLLSKTLHSSLGKGCFAFLKV